MNRKGNECWGNSKLLTRHKDGEFKAVAIGAPSGDATGGRLLFPT